MVIPPERFRDEEYFQTKDQLEKAGYQIFTASTHRGICAGSRGGFVEADITLDEVICENYVAVAYVGGGGSNILFNNLRAQTITLEMNQTGKIVAAICLAPVILANAGVLRGKRATVAGTKVKAIEEKGAIYTGPGVTIDGNLVTANAPKASRLFGQVIVDTLAKQGSYGT